MSAVVSEMLIRIAADTAQLRSEMNEAKRAVGGSLDEIKGMASSLRNQLIGLFAGIGAAKLAQEFVQTADAMAGLEARLKNTTGAGEDFAKAQKEIYRIAQQNNIGIQEATTLFTKMNEPVKRLGGNVHDTAGIVEAFALSLRLGGASTQEAASATLQFGQAMGSGKLQGDEFRAMAEASPRFMKALAEGMNVPIEKLKKMGSEGELTADVVGNALIKSLDKLKSEAGTMPDSVGGSFQRMKNDIILAVDELNKNSGLTLGIAHLIEAVRTDLLPAIKEELGGAFKAVGDWIESNRDGLTDVWNQIKAAGSEAWELVKAVAAGLKPIADWIVQSGALKIAWESIRLIIAGVTDGVNLIAAAIKLIAGDADGARKIWDNFKEGKTAVGALNEELAGTRETTKAVAAETTNAAAAADSSGESYTKLKNKHTELTTEQKHAIKVYQKLIETIKDKTGSMQAEMDKGTQLTEGQKLSLKVMQDIQGGQLKLTTAQKQAVTAALEQLLATEQLNLERKREIQVEDELRKMRDDDAKAAQKEAESIEKEVEAQKKANDAMRLTKQQLGALEVARLNERIAIMEIVVQQDELIGVCTKETEAHKATLEALRELRTEREQGVYLEAAKDAAEEWKKTSDSIASNLTDALMRGFESGKGFMQNFRDTLKNLFNTLILRPIIQPIAQGLSGSLMSAMGFNVTGSAGGSVGSSLGSSLLTSAGSALGITGMGNLGAGFSAGMSGVFGEAGMAGVWDAGTIAMGAGNVGGGIGTLAGGAVGIGGSALAGYGLGRMIGGQYSVGGMGSGTSAAVGTAIGMAIAGPIGAIVGGALGGVFNRAFGMGAREYGQHGITGSLSSGGATGQTYANWHQDGGWFRSDRSGTDYASLPNEIASALNSGTTAIYQQTRAWANALKLPADSLASVTHDFRVELTDDAAQNQQALTNLMNGYQADLVQQYAGFLAPLQRAGETLADTMGRLAVIQTFSDSIQDLGGIFTRISQSSFQARQSLIDMAGGLDSLVGQINQFVSDYYTEAERAGLSAQAIAEALKAVGINAGDLMSREDYRALVESRDVSTEVGRQQLAVLLRLGPQFASLADYLQQSGLNVEAAIQDAPTTGLLAQMVDPAQTTATAVTNMAVSVDQSNALLTSIENKLSTISDTSRSAADAAQAAVQAAANAVKAAQEAVSAASLVTSAPTYSYNIGGN